MFKLIQNEVYNRFNALSNHDIFQVALGKDILFDAYLNCFPIELRQEHNCSCCKHFLRNYGNIVAIIDNEIRTIWDFETDYPYNKIPAILRKIVLDAAIDRPFLTKTSVLGTSFNLALRNDEVVRYDHFYCVYDVNKLVPSHTTIGEYLSKAIDAKNVFKRSLNEITLDSLETVLELIDQNSIYRGQEFKKTIVDFIKAKKEYDVLNLPTKELFVWNKYTLERKLRNSVIGTLLVDLSNGMDINKAVESFEYKVAPLNYKRPTAIVTKEMIERAEKELSDIGLDKSIYRRHATVEDIPVNKVLFVDRSITKSNLFAELKENLPIDTKKFKKIETVPIDMFIKDIIPTCDSIEILLNDSNSNNLMNLTSPLYNNSTNLFKWSNSIGWTYTNNATDSIKERIKKEGGTVEAELRVSLEWFNYDDLDLHVIEPNGNKIWYYDKVSEHGFLDIDMNAGMGKSRESVENIIFPDINNILEGKYVVSVNNFCKRETIDIGFGIEVESKGELRRLVYSTDIRDQHTVDVATFTYSKRAGIENFESCLDITDSVVSKPIWNLHTNKFYKISIICDSPNYWDNGNIGNKHIFFIIKDAINPFKVRGIYNEYLKQEFLVHRKVIDMLSSRNLIAPSENQLAGLGFSSTQRNEVILRLSGKTSRVIKVLF